MITMTAADTVEAGTLLVGWLDSILRGAVDAPPRLALRIQRTHRAFDQVVRDLLGQEDAILRRHGALEDEQGFVPRNDEPGTFIIDDPEQLAACMAARAALFRTEVEIDAAPLPLEEILAAGLTLTGRQAIQLSPLFEDHAHTTGD